MFSERVIIMGKSLDLCKKRLLQFCTCLNKKNTINMSKLIF